MKLTNHFRLMFWADSTHYKVWYDAGQIRRYGSHWLAATSTETAWTTKPTRSAAVRHLCQRAIEETKTNPSAPAWDKYVRGRARALLKRGGKLT